MQRGERVERIQRIARALAGRSWADIDLVLESFSFTTSDFGDWSDEYDYVVAMVKHGEDSDLVELDEYLARDAVAIPDDSDAERVWKPGAFRLFISHTSAHRARASRLASAFERLEGHGFVAHETIEPTREWQDVIETALLTCDALCALVTPDFRESKWCDQEVGFVVAQRKLVVPLQMGADPHGFIGKYQAIPSALDRDTTYADIETMLYALIRHPSTAAKGAALAVRRYVRSGSFDAARAGFALLQAIPEHTWTPGLIEEVDRAHATNSQLIDGNLTGGRPIPDATNELLRSLRPASVPEAPDGDIPF